MLVPSISAPAKTVRFPDVKSATVVASRSAPAAFDFPATHVVLSWTGYENLTLRYRTIGSDGVRGKWRVAEEAHDLEHGDRHYTGVLEVDRAARLEWLPEGRRARSLPSVQVFYMNTEDGPIVERTVPSVARAAATEPDIRTRAEWGADESMKSTKGGCDRDFYPLQQLFVHHTVSSNNPGDYDAMVRAIYEFHTKGRGWCDLGYNFLIAPNGTIYEGRWARNYSPWELHNSEDRVMNAVAGAQVAGHNSGSVGISLIGTFTSVKPTIAARSSLVELLAWEADRHDIDPTAKHVYVNPETGDKRQLRTISGHRDAGQTACPGNRLYEMLPKIRKDVAATIGTGKTATYTTLLTSAAKIDYGQAITLSGHLTAGGVGLAGRTLDLWSKAGGKWTLADQLLTGESGAYSYEVAPARNSRFEVRFSGDSVLWDSASSRRQIRVKPLVTLETDQGATTEEAPAQYAVGQRAALSGGLDPAAGGSQVKLKIFMRRPDGTEKLVREKKVGAESGAYSSGYRPKKPGRIYRAVTWFPKGSGYVAARSNAVFFQTP
jgi:hypothetical protein